MIDLLAAYDGDVWIDWSWVGDHTADIRDRFQEHATLTFWAMLVGITLAFPLALLAYTRRGSRAAILTTTGILYTIPSLAAFALLLPFTKLSRTTAIIPLATYTLLILIRNILTGLDGVPDDVRDAAKGMGYSRGRRLFGIEVPLALPKIFAGIRIALVTVIGLIPVAAFIGQGGLGQLMRDGFARDFKTPLTVGVVLTVAFAIACDLAVLGVQRLATPWARRER